MTVTVKAYAAMEPKGELQPFEYQLGEIGYDEVDIAVSHCGICHSDLSMIDNEWGYSQYPLVPGHEIIGKITAVGEGVTHLSVGQTVGVGWSSASCNSCRECLSGYQNTCLNSQDTIAGHHGGFADKVRVQSIWAIPIPDGVDPKTAGPLLCGGITVFNPLIQYNIKPTDRVGVVGIGGLGHLAVKYMKSWGCEVTAFSGSASKTEELKAMGAHHVVNSRDPKAVEALAGTLDFIIVTVNAPLEWDSYINALRPLGRLHFVGAVLEPVAFQVFGLLGGQKQISASPTGNPVNIATMLEFSARHNIEPIVEFFPLAEVNKAIRHLRDGKAKYRIVLEV